MKKTVLLAGVAILAMASCSKSGLVNNEAPVEIAFKDAVTKGPELDGASLGTDNSYVIYAAASANGYPKYFAPEEATYGGQLFAYSADKWFPASFAAGTYTQEHIYWPFGGVKVDYLAYALTPAAKTALDPKFNSDKHAQDLTIADWDTYANQYDVLYAVANDQEAGTSGNVALTFKHSQALLAFNVKKSASTTVDLKINSITIKNLGYKGTLKVDNYRSKLDVKWTIPAGTENNGDKALTGTFPAEVTTTEAPVATNLLIPQQPVKEIVISYNMGGQDFTYSLNIPRGTWEMGQKYVYNLVFSAAEISFTESVTPWNEVADAPLS